MTRKVRVLVVDDSAVVRQTLAALLGEDPEIEVLGTASDPFVAAQRMRQQIPDVITLDLEMPRMDGLTFLQKLMTQHPLPVLICSSLAEKNGEAALRALELGAVDVICKPSIGTRQALEASRQQIVEAVKAAALARLTPRPRAPLVQAKLTADAMLPPARTRPSLSTTEKVVAVGASTGGTEALRVLLEGLPAQGPGLVIVQHMPEKFTAAFARRLNSLCALEVKEAVDGDAVLPGRALIAPGNRHTLLRRNGARYHVEVKDGPLVCRHRPSVDVLFRSAATQCGRNAVGVILTGMGDDGARGLAEMKASGAFTVVQDEESCVVFGMPGEAIKLGGVDRVVPLGEIADEILRHCA